VVRFSPWKNTATHRVVALIWVALTACSEPDASTETWPAETLELLFSLSPPGPWPTSDGNEFADDLQAARLGRALFFDTGLSANGEIACASCHVPAQYFSDGRRRAIGLSTLRRNTPSVIGAGAVPFLYWDGRKDSLWSQALSPLEAADEHGLTRMGVARRIWAHHRAAYERVFGPLPDLEDPHRYPEAARPIPEQPTHPHHRAWFAMDADDRRTVERIFVHTGKALEAYQRRLLPGPAPFDRFVSAVRAGDPSGGGHLDETARRGLRAFLGPAGCVRCHSGPMFTDHEFHNLGLPPEIGISPDDPGRASGMARLLADEFRCGSPHDPRDCQHLRFIDPAHPDLAGAFRTPSLRNVAATPPYMHTGQLATLESVIAFYRTLPGAPAVGRRDPTLLPLSRNIATEAMVAFLRSLTGPLPDAEWLAPP
jgi:cytochrome c peroxidase